MRSRMLLLRPHALAVPIQRGLCTLIQVQVGRLVEELGIRAQTTGRPKGARRRREPPPPGPAVGGATNLTGELSASPIHFPQNTSTNYCQLSISIEILTERFGRRGLLI